MKATDVKSSLEAIASSERAFLSQRFFKTGEGEYGEGDVFMGITVPTLRLIAKASIKLPLDEVEKLLQEKYHECRVTALLILVERFKKAIESDRGAIATLYLRNTHRINNWDLVDLSAHYILGKYLMDKDRSILHQLADSTWLWDQRIAVISTFEFIRNGDYTDNLILAEKLLNHRHDLMHKAIGWMLREIGKRNKSVELDFLMQFSTRMPRTMLRYAIEKFPEDERQFFLKRNSED